MKQSLLRLLLLSLSLGLFANSPLKAALTGRYFLKKAGSKRSVYRAFGPLIRKSFKVCK